MDIKLFLFLYLLPIINFVNCAKILGIFTFPSKSHSILIETITTELAKRNHELTVISNFALEEKLNNYTEILISSPYDYWKNVKNLFELENMKASEVINMMHTMGLTTTEYALQNENIQNFIKNDKTKYDLIILEQYYQEAFLVLANKYNAPIVTLATFGLGNYMNVIVGGFNPLAHVPHELLVFDENMNFGERLKNVYITLYEYYHRNYIYIPKMNLLAKKYLTAIEGHVQSIDEIEKNISMIFVNTNFALTTSRPLTPTIIPIGGCHIKNPKTLQRDIRQFLDDAIYGAVYFSLGTNLRSSDLPNEKLEILLNTFSKMKQKVLWKFENDKIKKSKIPKNVMIKKWMPQSDILAHPHVRVFITHGGILSVQEGIFRAVPMLGFPVFTDQLINMNKAEKGGYAISFSITNLTEQSLTWALNELFKNPTYAEKISTVSKLFRDRPIRALDETIYWLEYVIRYNGAETFQSSGRNISWYKYFLLDIFAVILLDLIVISGLIILLVKIIKIRRNKKRFDKKII